jgi:CheY-like chemotaxis protein
MAHVLVVDDDPWSRHIVMRLLERRGHRVEAAADMREARAQLAQTQAELELVLLDINLPGGSGELLLQEIRARDRALPVIAVTASAMSGDRERFLRLGFTAYLSKPIDVRSFADTVEQYMEARR